MNIFVTGGSGFLGKHLVERLVADGHSVSGLARSASSSKALAELGVKPVQGELENIVAWDAALEGQDAVIHCAAPLPGWGAWEDYNRDITLATRKLLESSARHHVKRFIFISSEAAVQDVDPLLNIDETYPYPAEPNSYYGKAKKLAEQAILNFSGDIESIIIRPASLWGAGGKTFDEVEAKIKSGQFMWIDQGKYLIETTHVKNAAEAIMLALTKGKAKNIYFVTDDDPVSVRAYFTPFIKLRGIPMPRKNMPNALIKPAAIAMDYIWKRLKLKNPPPVSKFEWSFVAEPRTYRLAKIKQDLGYHPVITRDEGIKEYTGALK